MAANDGEKLHGKNGAIYINGAKGVGDKVSLKTEWTLNLNRDYVDGTVFGDINKTYLVGLKDISGTYAGFMDNAGDFLVNATDSDEVATYLYSDDRDSEERLIGSGLGLHDSSINCSNSDAVRVSGNFRAAGPWAILA